MTPTSPVPSRAALNALRGVLFTTSCSVILLAEERRRRLNIARAAIENARKLHTVQSNRGPVALNEGLEAGILDLNQEVALGRPKKSHRRRRRDDVISYLSHDPDFEIHKHYSDHDGVELKSQDAQKNGLSKDPESIQPQCPRPLPHPLQPLQFLAPSAFCYKLSESQNQVRKTGEDEVREARIHTPSSTTGQQYRPNLLLQDIMALLRRSLEDLQRIEVDFTTTLQSLNIAVAALKRVVFLKPPPPVLIAILENEGLEVFKRVVELDPARMSEVLRALVFRSEDLVESLYPLIQWLQARDHIQALEQMLVYLTARKLSRSWMGGLLIYRLLHRFEQREGYEQMKKLYEMLSSAGLFNVTSAVRNSEYRIRAFVFKKAFEAGDEVLAQRELEMIRKLDPDYFKTDVRIQGRFITWEASLGHWDVVRSHLDALSPLAVMKSKQFSELLSRVLCIFSQSHSAPELECLLRGLMSHFRMPLKLQWVNSVLDEYASRHDLDSVSSWLRFCIDNGFTMEAGFLDSLFSRCRKYWSFSDKSMESLCQTLQEFSMPISSMTPVDRPQTEGALEGESPMSHADEKPMTWQSQADTLKHMESLAAREEWEGLCEAYNAYLSSDLGFSSSCLRLAVLGWLQRGAGGIEQASLLVKEAREQGHDVTKVLIPLLMARLEKGDNGHALIQDALHHGVRLHDSIYNKATRATMAKGDMQGAIDLCHLAAKENGNRDLLYSDYNFSNLLFAYTGTGKYGYLKDILTRFTSGVQWWKGSSRCKESIKLAMKTTAARAVVNPESRKKHEEALFKLDEAFLHMRKCRTTRRDRWAVKEAMVRLVRQKGDEETGEQLAVRREALEKEIASPSLELQAVSVEC